MPLDNFLEAASLESAVAAFAAARPRLFGIAYRMLGSVAEAEDLIQETWLRWQSVDRSVVQGATAYLVTVITRLALNEVQSARVRHETYVGQWLPEPVDTSADPQLGAERGEALGIAVLLLLERLTASERAAYVLREAFDYDYEEIARILELTEPNVRQLVSRARKHLTGKRRPRVSSLEQERLLEVFLAAAQKGNLTELEELFALDVVSYSDGGGAARAAIVPILGRPKVVKFIVGFAGHFWTETSVQKIQVNGQSSMLILRDGVAIAVATVDASAAGIDGVYWLLNPAKLEGISASLRG